MGIAAVVDRSGGIHALENETGSHDYIIRKQKLKDTVSGEIARVYLMPPSPQDYFNVDAYELYMRGARFERRRKENMRRASDIQRPSWLDDDRWMEIENELLMKMRKKLSSRPIVVTEYLDLSGVKDIKIIPQVIVRHCVNIERSSIEGFEPGSVLFGSLYAKESQLKPEGLERVSIGTNKGVLWIEGLSQMTRLPDSLKIGGNAQRDNYSPDIFIENKGKVMAAGSGLIPDNVPEHLKGRVFL
jgi:hypothetical protein